MALTAPIAERLQVAARKIFEEQKKIWETPAGSALRMLRQALTQIQREELSQ